MRAIVERLMSRTLLGYFAALATRAVEVIGKFGLYFLAARLMGGHDSGLFFLCLSWVNLSSTAARLGLERAMSRHIAAELAVGHGRAARQALVTGVSWIVLASFIAALLTFVLAGPAAQSIYHQPDLAVPLHFAALILPTQTLAFTIGFALIGMNRAVLAQIVQSALPPALSLLALVAGLHRLDTVLIVYACSYGVCCCLGGAFILRDWHGLLVDRPQSAATPPDPLPPLWTTARPLFVVELVQVSLLSLPVLALGAFADPVAVSAFSIVSRMTMMINTILVSIATIASPAFARYHRRGEYAQLRHTANQARFLAMAVCLPIIAIMVIFPHTLLSLLGHDFASHAAVAAMIVLCAGQLVNVFLPTEDMMLTMTGHGRTLRALNLQQIAVCCLLGAVLIPLFGLIGAAVLSAVVLIQGRVSFALAVRRVLPELSAPGTIAA